MMKIRPSRGLRTFAALGLSLACAHAAASQVAPTPSVAMPPTHALGASAAPPLTDPPVTDREYRQYSQPDTLPLSLATDDDKGALFSRNVNRINDSADRVDAPAGAKRSDETWLATGCGVKCVDQVAGVVRHYGIADGLPGLNVVAIAADAHDVWCLVRDTAKPGPIPKPPSKLRLCRLDPRSGRWVERKAYENDRTAQASQYGSHVEGHCRLALSRDYLAVVTSTVSSVDPALVHLYDRKTGEFRDLPWDSGLRADVDSIASKALVLDKGGVWFGTDHGLFHWIWKAAVWKRLLPDRIIDFAAVSPMGDTVWTVNQPRQRPGRFDGPPRIVPDWQLSRITASDNTITDLTPPSLTVRAGDRNEFNAQITLPGGDPPVNLREHFPIGMSVAEDGSVWTTHQGISSFASTLSTAGSGWLRYDPAADSWHAMAVHLVGTKSFPVVGRPARYEIDESGANGTISVPFESVPDSAVRPLALVSSRVATSEIAYTGDRGNPELFWLHHRFPEWICPDSATPLDSPAGRTEHIAAIGVPTILVPPARPFGRQLYGPIPDPADPGLVWLIGYGGGSLVHCPVADGEKMREQLWQMRTAGPGPTLTAGHGQTYPLLSEDWAADLRPAGALMVRPDIVALIPGAGSASSGRPGSNAATMQPTMTVATTEAAYAATGDSTTLAPMEIRSLNPFHSRWNPGLAADLWKADGSVLSIGDQKTGRKIVSSRPSSAGPTTLFDKVAVPGVREVLAVNPVDGGVWVCVDGATRNGNTAVYIAGAARSGGATADAPVVATGPLVSGPAWRLVGATASVAWWASNSNSSQAAEVRGYDAVNRRWLADLPGRIATPLAMDFARCDSGGTIYVACEATTGTAVWRYDTAANHWVSVAPAPPAPDDLPTTFNRFDPVLRPQLMEVSKDAILLAGYNKRLYRFDRARGQWDKPVSLPEPLQKVTDLMDRCAAAVSGFVYVGGRGGLYRLTLDGPDGRLPEKPSWTSIEVNLAAPNAAVGRWANRPVMSLSSIVPERKTVFALARSDSPSATIGARLDVVSGKWTFYDESRGFPSKDAGTLFGDGEDGAWIVCLNGTYRFDRASDRWQEMFANDLLSETRLPESVRAAAAHPPLAEVDNPVVLTANGHETDVMTKPAYKTGGTHNADPVTIWRFANDDGRLIGTVLGQKPWPGFYRALLPAGNGDLWAGMALDFYRIHLDAAQTERQWQPIDLPPGAINGPINGLSYAADGGLWIIGLEEAYLWKKPHG